MLILKSLPNGDVQVEQELQLSGDAGTHPDGPLLVSATLTRVYRAVGNAVYQIHPGGHLVRARAGLQSTGPRLRVSGSLADTLRLTLTTTAGATGLTPDERRLLGLSAEAGGANGASR